MSAPTKVCPNCKREYVPELTHHRRGYAKWCGGALIQNAFPNAEPFEREQLMTGICSDKCWDEYLGPVRTDGGGKYGP